MSRYAAWTHNWTILFILAFISWVPFVAIFIARISIGRTIREVILGVMFMPAIALCLWFSALGGNGIYIDAFGVGGMQEHLAKDFTLGIFYLIEVLFDSDMLGAAMIFLIFVFLVTSGEAIVYSLAMLSEHGEAKPSSRNIIYWSVIMFIITSLVINSDNIFVILALSGVGAVPLILVFILSCIRPVQANISGYTKRLIRIKSETVSRRGDTGLDWTNISVFQPNRMGRTHPFNYSFFSRSRIDCIADNFNVTTYFV